jgi:predicted DNA binding CopG/RHH family protein
MKKAKQIHSRVDKLTPTETVRFLEDFSNMIHGQDQKTKLISLRVPENILNVFKTRAKSEEKKYQTVIIQLMREWANNIA